MEKLIKTKKSVRTILLSSMLCVLMLSAPAMAGSVEDLCKERWGTKYRMLEHCIKKQFQAKEEINKWYSKNMDIDLLEHCAQKWIENFTVDYNKVLYCIVKQQWSKERIQKWDVNLR